MAKNYAGMDTEELKALAEEQKQRQAALNQLARSDPSAMKAMTANERVDFLNQRNQERTDAWHAANDKARAGRFKDMLGTEGGRYSPVTIAAARKYLEENGYGQEGERRRQFDEQQKTVRIESENKKLGMIGQGKEAAEAHASAQLESAKLEHGWDDWEYDDDKKVWTHHQGSRERLAEQEAAAKKYLAEQGAATQRYGIDAEHGKIGADGTVTPGSRERTAKIQGESEIHKQEAANKGLLAQAEITRQNKEKELANVLDKAMIEAGSKANSDMNAKHAKIIAAALGTMSDMNDVSDVFKKLTEQYKDDPDMMKSLGVVRQQMENPDGQQTQKNVVTDAKGAKWQVIYDENGKPVGKKPIK